MTVSPEPMQRERLTLIYRDCNGRTTEVAREFDGGKIEDAVDLCADALAMFGWSRSSISEAMAGVEL